MSERDEGTTGGGVTNAEETGGTGGYGGTSEESGADEQSSDEGQVKRDE